MNINKFLVKAKEADIDVAEIKISKTTSSSVSIFRGEIDSNEFSSTSSLTARGIYKGKLGAVSSENLNDSSIDSLIKDIKTNATLIEKEEEPIIYQGSKDYKKKNTFNKQLSKLTTSSVLPLLYEIERKTKEKDSRVSDVQVSFQIQEEEFVFANSYGLNLKTHSNYFVLVGEVYMKEGEITKDNYTIKFGNKFEINVDEFVDELVKECSKKFNAIPIQNGTYKGVIDRDAVADLVNALISNASSEQTQKHSSIFEGKEGQKVVSSKITIDELPLKNNVFRAYFDSEGVATQNKTIIKNGVLETLFYNLETAKKAGKESTGNGQGASSIGVGFTNITVKKGRLTKEELINKVNNGVYITSITGLHAGLDPRSGDFSLQAEGFLIKNGKLDNFLTLFTVGGNLFRLFNDVVAVGNDSKLMLSSIETPSIAFKNLKISA